MIGYELARVRKALEHAGLSHQFQTFTRYNKKIVLPVIEFINNATTQPKKPQASNLPVSVSGNIERFITEDVLLPLLLVVPHYSVQ